MHICLLALVTSKAEAIVGRWLCHLHAVAPTQNQRFAQHPGTCVSHFAHGALLSCTTAVSDCCVVTLRHLHGALAHPLLLRPLHLRHLTSAHHWGAPTAARQQCQDHHCGDPSSCNEASGLLRSSAGASEHWPSTPSAADPSTVRIYFCAFLRQLQKQHAIRARITTAGTTMAALRPPVEMVYPED